MPVKAIEKCLAKVIPTGHVSRISFFLRGTGGVNPGNIPCLRDGLFFQVGRI